MINKWVVYVIYGLEYICIFVGKLIHSKGTTDGSVCNGHHYGCKIQEIIQYCVLWLHFLGLISLGTFQCVCRNPTPVRKTNLGREPGGSYRCHFYIAIYSGRKNGMVVHMVSSSLDLMLTHISRHSFPQLDFLPRRVIPLYDGE